MPVAETPLAVRSTGWLLIALVVVTPLVVTTDTRESFRTVKGLAAGWLALASLIACTWPVRALGRVSWRAAVDTPGVRAILPLLVVVLGGALSTRHPAHFSESAWDFTVGAVCLATWSVAMPSAVWRQVSPWAIGASVVVAALAVDQAWGVLGLLDGLGVTAPTERLAITSTLGNPGDVGASLVLPLLIACWRWPGSRGRTRLLLTMAIAVMATGLLVTATLAAVLAVMAGVLVLALQQTSSGTGGVPARRRVMAVVAILVVAILAGTAVTPVRSRVERVATALRQGDLNTVLTGRLDGWRVAAALVGTHPWTGVGQGGYVAEYASTKLQLVERGVTFHREQTQVMFDTPHNEYLSVAAEQGWPGLVALAWGIGVLGLAACRQRGDARALAVSSLAALGVLALAWFPMHVAAVAWPWVMLLAWVGRREEGA